MQNENLIDTEVFCASHKIEFSFIDSLQYSGLIEIKTVEEKRFLTPDEICRLEEFVRMHYDLDINVEGIEAIAHLLDRVRTMQAEILHLKNQLRRYESM